MPLPDKDVMCHHTGFTKSCRSIVVECKCPKYVSVMGTNPQGGEVNHEGCVDSIVHLLLIENSQQQRQTGAAVESFRNEMVKANESSQRMLEQSVNNKPLTLDQKH